MEPHSNLTRYLFDDLHRAPNPFSQATREQEGSKRVDRLAAAANDSAYILGLQSQFIDRRPMTFHGNYGDLLRMTHQGLHDVFEEALHARERDDYQATGFGERLIKLATVSEGRAPLLSQ